ncbi:MAG: phosphorylase family protein [Gaiellaceae bacterium]
MTDVVAPLAIEAWAVRGRRVGMGAREAPAGEGPLVIAGVCGALDPSLRPGDLVVASEVRGDGEPVACATDLAAAIGARVGPIVSVDRIASRAEKRSLFESGAIAVDMESYRLARSAGDRPVAVVRAVVDRADRRLLDPRTIPAGIAGLVALRRAAPRLGQWSSIESRS